MPGEVGEQHATDNGYAIGYARVVRDGLGT